MSTQKLTPIAAHAENSENLPSWLAAAEDFFQERRSLAIGVLAALLLLPIGSALYFRARAASEREAQAVLARADRELLSGNVAPAGTFYQDVVDRFGGSPSASWAQVGLGRVALAQGRPADALTAFSRSTGARDPLLAAAARRGRAAALEDSGKPAEAGAEYEKLAGLEKDEAAVDDLLSAARSYRNANNVGQARSILTALLKDHPQSPRHVEAQTLLAELQ
jgi:tetratricopeptide (TPR) repeat protein